MVFFCYRTGYGGEKGDLKLTGSFVDLLAILSVQAGGFPEKACWQHQDNRMTVKVKNGWVRRSVCSKGDGEEEEEGQASISNLLKRQE